MSIANLPQGLDVILVRGSSTQSTGLCWLQSIAMLRRVSFSHVILSMGEGICLHATTAGVDLIRPSEIWTSPDYQARKVVLRSTHIRKQIPTVELLRQAHQFMRKSFGARYNRYFGIPKEWIGLNTWFCSELAADALKQVKHSVVPKREPEEVWPGHFQHYCYGRPEWEDVTVVYETYLKEITKGADQDCTDVFAHTRYLTGEATFLLYKNAFSIMRYGDIHLEELDKLDAKLRITTDEIIKRTNEIKERMKK